MRIEVIATSLDDAIDAARGGAHRLEVVRDLSRDGLTPAIDLVRRVQRDVALPLRVMVRESDGFMCRSGAERRRLAEQAAELAALGVDGIVVGWNRDGRIDEEALGSVLAAAPSLRATFHRAFDALADPEAALSVLRRYPQIDRVLTSGGQGAWTSRLQTLAQYARWAGPRIGILPGGGIDADALRVLARAGAAEAHIGRAARAGQRVAGRVSAEAVRQLIDAANASTG